MILLIILVGLTPLIASEFSPVEFNQFLIQKVNIYEGKNSEKMTIDYVKSKYLQGIQVMSKRDLSSKPEKENKEEFISYIFSWAPPYAVVYPTEGFFYYTTEINGELISGNLRVPHIDDGILNYAYFNVNSAHNETYYGEITEEDGLSVQKISDEIYKLRYKEKEITLKIPKLRHPSSEMLLLETEEIVGEVRDESGVNFWLVFNDKTKSFYFILDEKTNTEDLVEVPSTLLLYGKRTEFVYYFDESLKRKILVGVKLENVMINNFFDGPGDQVPYVPLKDKLYESYPNTWVGAGIDEYGVLLNRTEWARVAITPFMRYASMNELQNRIDRCSSLSDEDFLFTCITKEYWNNPLYRKAMIETL